MKKSVWAGLLIAAMLAGAAGAETAGETVPVLELPALESGTIAEIPVEQDSLVDSIAPKEDCYLYEASDPVNFTGYADPSLTVNIGKGRIYETDYVYARVKTATPSQLRTLLASAPGASHTAEGHKLAKRVNAVIAINGDFCGGDNVKRGAIMRQGKLYRMKCSGGLDLLVIDRRGDFHILLSAQDEDMEALREDAVNIFTFGPALVVDGEALPGRTRPNLGGAKPAQRMAICQTGELEYLLITSEGPEDPGSTGLNMAQFVELVSSFPDVKQAYNLDGGSSSTMVFRRGDNNWQKINAPNNRKIRPLKDIIYFASAWDTD